MTVALTGTGGYFTRLGKIGKEYLRVVGVYGSTLDSAVEAIRDQYETGAQGVVVDGIYGVRNAYRTVHGSYLSSLQSMAVNNTVEQVNDDTTLVSRTLSNALLELITQMKASSDSILRGTTGATVTAGAGNKGDGGLIFSFTNRFGDALQYPYPETIRFSCTSDSTAFAETFTFTGAPQKAVTDATWPGGSGASGSLTLVNPASGGLLTNGNFASWSSTSAPPDSWTFTTGTAGTDLVRSTDVRRTGTGYSIQFVGNGSLQHDIRQTITGLTANQVLGFRAWAKTSASDANAVLQIRLIDAAGNTIQNDAGGNNAATFDLNTTIGTSWTAVSTFFQMPRQLPTGTITLQIRISAGSIDSGKSMYLSLAGMTTGQQLYAAGPFCAGFSATLPHAVGDTLSAAVTNSVTTDTFVRVTQRCLGMDRLGENMYFPSVASSPTVADSLLT